MSEEKDIPKETQDVKGATQATPVHHPEADKPEGKVAVQVAAKSGKTYTAEQVGEILTAWWNENVHGSPVAHSTAAWNHLSAAWENLHSRF